MRLSFIAWFLLIFIHAVAQKEITIDDFTTRNTFAAKTVSGINWMADGKFYTSLKGNRIVKMDITSGAEVDTIYDGKDSDIGSYSFSRDEKKLLISRDVEQIYRRSSKASFLVFDIASKTTRELSTGGKQSYATFSPDGTRVAFVRANNLFMVDLASGKETQLTTDGKTNSIINGSTDWVYEEELSLTQAFAWSPDGNKIAHYRFDESGVREYNLQKWNDGALYPEDYRYKYPKAGEANSTVEVWITDLSSMKKIKADLGQETDIYVPRMNWTMDPNTLAVRTLNRLQNTMQLLHINASTGSAKVVLTEKNEKYYDIAYTGDLIYLQDGKRLVISSERTGFKHFYLYGIDGTLERPLTSGNFEATQLVGIDQKNGVLYYLSTEGNYLNRTLYSIDLTGKKKTKLSAKDGSRTVNMSGDARYYIDYYSTPEQPYLISLYQTQGNKQLRILETNEELARKYKEYGVPAREYFQYTAGDGKTKVDGYIMKPALQSGKKYPVLVFQYSGPRSNSVSNNFGSGSTASWHHMLVQKGIAVAVVDTRGTGSRGEAFTKQTYKELGKLELEDLLAVGKYLGSLDYIDKDRLAVWGWSYGGYMASLVMTKGAGVYKVGIAGAPVTSWRYYDNIYTERFLQRPQDNPDGYDKNSPLNYADKLEGEFLLIHGTGDDNVHFQNSVALEEALIKAGKQFRSHFYPDQAHGFRGSDVNKHRWTLMTNFLLEKL